MEPTPKIKFSSVGEYIASFPEPTATLLQELRMLIRSAAPEAQEVISYNMPAFRFHGILLYFAGHKGHIGFYPGNATLIEGFGRELDGYATSKGTIQFRLDKPLPHDLIIKIVTIRVSDNLVKAAAKTTRKKSATKPFRGGVHL